MGFFIIIIIGIIIFAVFLAIPIAGLTFVAKGKAKREAKKILEGKTPPDPKEINKWIDTIIRSQGERNLSEEDRDIIQQLRKLKETGGLASQPSIEGKNPYPSISPLPWAEKKPIWKKWWFWVIAIFVILIIVSTGGERKEETVPEVQQPEVQQPVSQYPETTAPLSYEMVNYYTAVLIPSSPRPTIGQLKEFAQTLPTKYAKESSVVISFWDSREALEQEAKIFSEIPDIELLTMKEEEWTAKYQLNRFYQHHLATYSKISGEEKFTIFPDGHIKPPEQEPIIIEF